MEDMQYSIKDLENLSSIKAHTIRIWEKRYSLIEPARTDTNIRYYNDEDVKKLLNVAVLVQNGVKISHVAQLSPNEIKQKAAFILQNPNDVDNQVKNLILSMVELSESKFNKILNKSIITMGFEKTMMYLVYPFLEQIGVMWQTGSINPAHEHFISNLIRQKLMVAIDGIDPDITKKRRKFLLFLPEGELHELGLLFYSYLIKVRGHDVLYLGQATPLSSVAESIEIWPADYLVFFAISSYSGSSHNEYVKEVAVTFPDKQILVAGQQITASTSTFPKNVSKIENTFDLITIVQKLR
jgi:DNA-binding transcriptional MerR regulator